MARIFPITDGPPVPWDVMAGCESRAYKNHGQTLAQIAARGGLSCAEAYCVTHNIELVEIYKNPRILKMKWIEFVRQLNKS